MILLFGLLKRNTLVDINIHDTYFVMDYMAIVIYIAIYFGIVALIYWLIIKSNRKLSSFLNGIHIIVTFGGLLLIEFLPLLLKVDGEETFIENFNYNQNVNFAIHIINVIVIFAQFAFPVNVLKALGSEKK